MIKRLFIILIIVSTVAVAYAGDRAMRYPTGTPIDIYNSSLSNSTYLRKTQDDTTPYNLTVNNLYLGGDTDTYFTLSGNDLILYVHNTERQRWTTVLVFLPAYVTYDGNMVQFDGNDLIF